MDKNSNEDIKAKMQAALARKIGINGVPNAEVDGKNTKIGTSGQKVGTRKIHRRKSGSA